AGGQVGRGRAGLAGGSGRTREAHRRRGSGIGGCRLGLGIVARRPAPASCQRATGDQHAEA
ncbi:hypothetical protein, partial [Klebsiella pneumoniae]|uniref:hypothetical protein n=1 Tax=Klebsiella pneumoniae TaxID=573 RepID=UPI0027300793